jgi:hypothetical protein
MRELELTLFTDYDFGSPSDATRFLSVISEHPDWVPDKFGEYEPLREKLDLKNPSPFLLAWGGKTINETYSRGEVLFKRTRKFRYFGRVLWTRGRKELNRVTLRIEADKLGQGDLDAVIDIAVTLFGAIRGQYGFVCDSEEFVEKNVIDAWFDEKLGRRRGGRVQGTNLFEGLPGIYWVNLFGPAYLDFFGQEKLRTLGAEMVQEVEPDCLLIRTSDSPFDWNSAETVRTQVEVVEKLGTGAFFDLRNPDGSHPAPKFEKETTRGGKIGGVNVAPLSKEYFERVTDAKAFLTSIGERVEDLRTESGLGAALDHSVQSLQSLDMYLGTIKAVPVESVRNIAAYAGEVLRRQLPGQWALDPNDQHMPAVRSGTRIEYPLLAAHKAALDRTRLSDWLGFVLAGGERLITPSS